MKIEKQYDANSTAISYAIESKYIEDNDLGRKFLLDEINKFPRAFSILDVGFGNGIDLSNYQKAGFKYLYGIDPSTKLFQEVKNLTQNGVELKEGSFEKIPYDAKTFDIVVSRCALHYVKDISKAVTEVSRVLKDGGVFIATVSHPLADEQEDKDENGNVIVSLFNKKVTIFFPLHAMSEYFSGTLPELFNIKNNYEYSGPERDGKTHDILNVLCFTAVKK